MPQSRLEKFGRSLKKTLSLLRPSRSWRAKECARVELEIDSSSTPSDGGSSASGAHEVTSTHRPHRKLPYRASSTGALLPTSSADSQFYQMFDNATSPKRHGSLDMMLRPFSITSRRNLFAEGSVDSDGTQRSHTLKTTDKLEVKRAGGKAVVNRQYMVIKNLGSGEYGRVRLVVNLNDLQPYALKTVSKAHLKKSIRRVRSSLGRRSMNNLMQAARKAEAAMADNNAQGPADCPATASSSNSNSQQLTDGQCGLHCDLQMPEAVVVAESAPASLGEPGIRVGETSTASASTSGRPWEASRCSGSGSFTSEQGCKCGPKPPASPFQMVDIPLGSDPAARMAGLRLASVASLPAAARQAFQLQTASSDSAVLSRNGSGADSPKPPDMVREIAVMKKLDHPNIVKLHEVIDDPGTDSLLLVMEFVDGGTLEQPYINKSAGLWAPLPEITVHRHFREICRGLDYLHYNHVIHGDLKPANLMRSSAGRVKIGDFGSALIYQEAEGTWDGQVNGTPAFRAPETLTANCKLTSKVDVWAAGVCIYVWVFGQLPFSGRSILDIFESIRSAPLTFPEHTGCSTELKDLLSKVLVKDPRERWSLAQVMHHPWVTAHNTMPLSSVQEAGGEVVSVTAADMAGAISKQGRDAMLPLIMPIFKEVYFLKGEVMGQEGEAIFLIADGEVDVVVDTCSAGPQRHETDDTDDHADISAHEMLGMMSVESMTAIVSGTPRPWELGNGQMVVATHEPGEFVGLSCLVEPHAADSKATVHHNPGIIRARSDVMAYQASRAAMAAAMAAHPELKEALQTQVWRQRSDQTVMEAISALHRGQSAAR